LTGTELIIFKDNGKIHIPPSFTLVFLNSSSSSSNDSSSDVHHPKVDIEGPYVKKERGRKRLVTNWSDMKIRVNQYCRISENKIKRRPICKYC
jgi:hypothetical protein